MNSVLSHTIRSLRYSFKRSLGAAVSTITGMALAAAAQASEFRLQFDPDIGGQQNPLQVASGLGNEDPASIVFAVTNTALIFLGTITLVMIIIAGFMWLLAAGEEERISKAKDILKGSVVGLFIVMGSYGFAQYLFAAIQQATIGDVQSVTQSIIEQVIHHV